MSQRGHILVTPKGMELQATLLSETASDFPKITATSNFYSTGTLQVKKSPTIQSSFNLTSYSMPKSGYFGPKKPTVSILSPEAQNYNLYPSYLKKNPDEYPERHCCTWEPKSTTNSSKKVVPVMPKGKYIHHTLFNTAMEQKLYENPSMPRLNKTAQGCRARTAPNDIRTDNTDEDQMKDTFAGSKESWKTAQSEFFSSNGFMSAGNKPMTAGSGMRFKGTMKDWEQKEEKYVQTYVAHQKDFHDLMDRLETETNKRMNRYQENQHEPREFIKKFKAANEELDDIDEVHYKQELRFTQRLKKFQKTKYNSGWKQTENGTQTAAKDQDRKVEDKHNIIKEVRGFKPVKKLDLKAKILDRSQISVLTSPHSDINDDELFVLIKRARKATQNKQSFGSTDKFKDVKF